MIDTTKTQNSDDLPIKPSILQISTACFFFDYQPPMLILVATMESGRRTVKRKIHTPDSWDMSSQSSLQSCPPNEKSQHVGSSGRHNFSERASTTRLLSDDDMSIRRYHKHENEGFATRAKRNFRLNRPERLDMETVFDANPSFSPQPAPRHASDPYNTRFFPSPTSVLERRTSTGSFF